MNNRIRTLRKYLDLTQQEFAEKIGSSQNILANYETGRRNPSNSVINNICKTFNVREEWLRNGEGEMFLPEAGNELEALAKKYNLSHSAQIVIEKFVKMNESDRQILLNYFAEIANALSTSHYLENSGNFQILHITKLFLHLTKIKNCIPHLTSLPAYLKTASELQTKKAHGFIPVACVFITYYTMIMANQNFPIHFLSEFQEVPPALLHFRLFPVDHIPA